MRKWLGRLSNAIRPRRLDLDLERELRFHVNERIDELQDAGMSAEAAARLARQQFGNYTAFGIRMAAWKAGAALPQDGLHLLGRQARPRRCPADQLRSLRSYPTRKRASLAGTINLT